MRFIVRRLVRAFLLVWAVSALCFLFTEMTPGSFFDEMRLNPQISAETVSSLRAHYGLDRPLPVRYMSWIAAVGHGDLGFSIAYNAPVAPLLWERARNTLLLTVTATVLTWMIGVPLGVWRANRHEQISDRAIGTVSSLLVSVPEIVMAIALLAVAVRWRLVPVGGMVSLRSEELPAWGRLLDLLRHMVLPISILALGSVALVERHVRASVLEVLDTPYIHAATGLGIGRARLLFRHALPVAANPAISLFGFFLASLLGGSLLVEVITGWPGLGPLVLEATLSRDLYVVVATVMLSAVFMVCGTLVADLLLLACDPRIRIGGPDAQ
jgi:peptide/nickel transport system permease protein